MVAKVKKKIGSASDRSEQFVESVREEETFLRKVMSLGDEPLYF